MACCTLAALGRVLAVIMVVAMFVRMDIMVEINSHAIKPKASTEAVTGEVRVLEVQLENMQEDIAEIKRNTQQILNKYSVSRLDDD